MKKVIFKSLFTSILLVLGLSVGVKQTTHEVVEAATTTDVLTADMFNATDQNYKDFSGVVGSSGAVYAGNNAKHSSSAIQLRSKDSNSGIVTTSSAGTVVSVSVSFNSTTTSARKLDVYVSNTAFTSASQLYDNGLGEKVYSFEKATYTNGTEVVIEGNYQYIGFRSNSGALYLDNITINWQAFADYTATLHYNDGTTPDGSITSVDGKFTAPETPTRTGYAFDGWYTDDVKFENLFDFENTFATENIHLYAKWVDEKDTYLQTTSFALGFDYSLNMGKLINDASEVTNGVYTISAVVGDEYTVATNTLVKSSVGSNHVLSVNETTEDSTSILNHYTDLFYINKVNDKYTIQTMDGKYLTYGNTTSIELNLETEKTNNSEWTIENNTTTAPGTISIRKSDSYLLGYNTYGGRNEFGVCRSSYSDWYNLELTKIDASTSNYALRFGTEITTENYAKLGEVKSYGVLVAPTESLEGLTFKEWYGLSNGLEDLVNTLDVLNITNAKMQTTETGYSFGGLLQNIPETQIHTSVSAACYVVNAAGEVFFAEQKDMSIVGAATYYAEHAAELGLNETETTLVNVLKGM